MNNQPVKAKPFNMSAACREWYRKNRQGSSKECVAALHEEGIEVTLFTAQQVRYCMAKKRHATAKQAWIKRKPTPIRLANNVLAEVAELRAAKDFAREIGSIERAQQLLNALQQLGI